MPEAWQVREFQQQEFLNQIQRDSYEAVGDGDRDAFFLLLSMELAGQLVARRIIARGGAAPSHLALTTGDQLVQSYAGRFLRAIEEFSRTPEEAAQLLGRFLAKCVNSGLSEIGAQYLHQRVHAQHRLYDGHRGTDEVPFLAEVG